MSAEVDRGRWEHQPGDRYVIVAPSIVGNPDDGYEHHYEVFTPSQGSVDAAIRKGLTIGRDDDFNIWVLRLTKDEGHKLVATLWMHEVVDDKPDVLARMAEKAGL